MVYGFASELTKLASDDSQAPVAGALGAAGLGALLGRSYAQVGTADEAGKAIVAKKEEARRLIQEAERLMNETGTSAVDLSKKMKKGMRRGMLVGGLGGGLAGLMLMNALASKPDR